MTGQSVAENEVVLIDLSSLAYPIWHTTQSDPDANKTSQQVVARVRAISNGKPHVAVCCEGGRSFRRDITATYKANRPEQDGTLKHQITLACEQLKADGFPIWSVPGFEADDVIASATARALQTESLTVTIVTADKDLLQLVGPRVTAMNAGKGDVLDTDGVIGKFGVHPSQMRDYLTLVGDASDNIAGARGIGPKTAAELLAKFRTIDNLYAQLEERGAAWMGIKPAIAQSLREFNASGGFATARSLVTLREDLAVPFEALNEERRPQEVASFDMDDDDCGSDGFIELGDEHEPAMAFPPIQRPEPTPVATPTTSAAGTVSQAPQATASTAIAKREDAPAVLPVEWQLELGPRSLREARTLAKDMFDSRMFSAAYGTPQAVLSTVMLGRELGMPAMAALRGIHIIEGKHSLSAQLMVALVLKSGFAEYFEPIEFDDEHATFETHRKGARNPVRLTHTIEQAKQAGLLKADSNWLKIPGDMVLARAQSRLCRLVYPDLMLGLYTPDELREAFAVAA